MFAEKKKFNSKTFDLRFLAKKIGFKKIWLKKWHVKNFFGPENVWFKKNFGRKRFCAKNALGPKKFGVKRNLGWKNLAHFK